ncbi:MAG: hypothetical protein QNJ33_09640 [Crocosphaera sp.]|nr:hypothetical protein [Crocosphaera sp.]
MKFNNTLAAILTVALTSGINVSAFAASINVETIKENRIETTTNNKQSDKNTQSNQDGSQGSKCIFRC